jgi:hypothetical protein
MSYIVASIWSRFNSRAGQISSKGVKERLDKLGIIWWTSPPGTLFVDVVCKDRIQYEQMRRTLNTYAGCKVPIKIYSADGSLKYEDGVVPDHIRSKVMEIFS